VAKALADLTAGGELVNPKDKRDTGSPGGNEIAHGACLTDQEHFKKKLGTQEHQYPGVSVLDNGHR